MERVLVVGNPAAGGGRAAASLDGVGARVRRAGHEVIEVVPAAADDLATALVAGGLEAADRVVVVGGDGMVHGCLPALAGRDVPVGLVALGTGNDFARGLGLPLDDLDAAVASALSPAAPLDLIRVGERYVASVATLGFSADVNERANRMRRPRGSSRYTIATLLEVPGLRSLPLRIELDGEVLEADTTFLAVANTEYFGGGMRICPGADPTDGVLALTVVGRCSRLQLLRVLPRVFDGDHLTHPAVSTYTARRITISGADTRLWGDGEPMAPLPAVLEAAPAALHVAGARASR